MQKENEFCKGNLHTRPCPTPQQRHGKYQDSTVCFQGNGNDVNYLVELIKR